MERLPSTPGRLNVTHESPADTDLGESTSSEVDQTNTPSSGNLGAIFTAWQNNQDSLHFYVNYGDT
jgi:hypothetical protein